MSEENDKPPENGEPPKEGGGEKEEHEPVIDGPEMKGTINLSKNYDSRTAKATPASGSQAAPTAASPSSTTQSPSGASAPAPAAAPAAQSAGQAQTGGNAPSQPAPAAAQSANSNANPESGSASKEGSNAEPQEKEPAVSKSIVIEKKWADNEGQLDQAVDPNKAKIKTENAEGSVGLDLFHHKEEVTSEAKFDWEKKELALTPIKASVEVSVVHAEAKGEFDLGNWVKGLFGKKPEAAKKSSSPGVPGSGGPFAARVGDPTGHGTPLGPGIGSANVLIGNMPAWRAMMDIHLCPVVKVIIPDIGGVVLVGDPTVLINFMPACRAGDMVVEIPGGPNPISVGCPTVMIGAGGGGGGGGGGESGGGKKGSGLKLSGTADGDLDYAKAEAEASLTFNKKDGASAEGKIGAVAAVAHGSVQGGLSIPLPLHHSMTIGGQAEGFAGGAGAEASGSIGYKKGEGFHMKSHLGAALLFGGGLSFSLGIE